MPQNVIDDSGEGFKRLYFYKYQGSDRVDAITLLESQIHFINAINLIQSKIDPAHKLKLDYLPALQGSHILLLSIDWQAIADLFQGLPVKDFIDGAKTSIDLFSDLVKLHRSLKGKKPESEVEKSGNIIQLNFGTGNQFNINGATLNFYKKNPKVIEEVIRSFAALDADTSVSGIELSDEADGRTLVEITQNQFSALAQPNPYNIGDEYERIRNRVNIFVKTPDFYPKSKKQWKWEFIFNQRLIKATIIDKEFEGLINHGLRYGQGDRLVVDLKFTYKRDTIVNTFVLKKYEIIKVHNSVFRDDISQNNLLV